MKLAVISSSPLVEKDSVFFAYSPYVKELDIWAENSGEIAFMCPIWPNDKGLLISELKFPVAKIFKAREFNIKSAKNFILAVRFSFLNFYTIYRAMRWADHIHLRCPGNIGLMGCLVQILFPHKPKTAKYAGNWDPKAKQPTSYKIQRYILSNTFLTRNMQVLVYGEWEGSSKNIKPFFTASYNESDKLAVVERSLDAEISFIYVGTLAPGKRALYAVQLVESLKRNGFSVNLALYGNGREKENIQHYIVQNNLGSYVHLKGNQPQDVLKKAYQQSHFVVLPSKSEGWPKVIAEGMFWGCLPIVTRVSCIPFMLNNEQRGLFLQMDLKADTDKIISLLQNPAEYQRKVHESVVWSRKYTLDLFADEIKALLNR